MAPVLTGLEGPPAPVKNGAAVEKVGYLERLSPQEVDALRPLLRPARFPRGTVLFEQGDSPTELLLLHQGSVKLVRSSGLGRDLILELLFAGDLCGVLCGMDSEPFGMSAVCLEDVEVSRVPRQEFLELAEEFPGLVTKAVDVCRHKIRQQREMMAGLALDRADQRLARALLLVAARLGRREGTRITLPLRLDRSELADLVGTTPETAIRIMSRLRREGVLEEEDGVLYLDEAALRELSGS